MSDLNRIEAKLDKVDAKIDGVKAEVADLRVLVENRVTKLEVKAGMWGVLGGLVSGALWYLKAGH